MRVVVAGDRAGDHDRQAERTLRLRRRVARRGLPDRWPAARDALAPADHRGSRAADPADFHSSNGWVVAALQAAVAAITTAGTGGVDSDCHHIVATLQLAAAERWRHRHRGRDLRSAGRGAAGGRRRCLPGGAVCSTAAGSTASRYCGAATSKHSPGWRATKACWMPGAGPAAPRWSLVTSRAFGLSPMAREIDGVAFGNAVAVRSAVDGGATVVVSLCRMGTADVPDSAEHLTVPADRLDRRRQPEPGVRPRRHRPHGDGPGRCRTARVRARCGQRDPHPDDRRRVPHGPRRRQGNCPRPHRRGARPAADAVPRRRLGGGRAIARRRRDHPLSRCAKRRFCLAGSSRKTVSPPFCPHRRAARHQ